MTPPPCSVCWVYKWSDVPLSETITTLSRFIQVRGIEVFRLGINCGADGKELKVWCFCEHKLLRRHFGVRLDMVECVWESAGMVMEMVKTCGPGRNRSPVFSGSFLNDAALAVIGSDTFTFHFYVSGLVGTYVRERFDSALVDEL